jgi:hypothetical protein
MKRRDFNRAALGLGLSPLLADFVAQVRNYNTEAAASVSRNRSHHALSGER